MNEQEILEIFVKAGAIISGTHVVYASGKHGASYINKDAIYADTVEISRLCLAIAEEFRNDSVEAVVAPAIAGVILSQWTAYHFTEMTGRKVFAVYAERSPYDRDRFIIGRGYDRFVRGRKVLVAEDVLNTGATARKVIEAVQAIGGNVVGLGVLCNRGETMPEDVANVPKFFALLNLELDAWDEDDCPLCRGKIPINTTFGRGSEFLAKKRL